MQIMCYEQLLKMLFKSKQSQHENFKYSQQNLYENSKPSKPCTKIPMNPLYDHLRKYIDSDESCSSTTTCLETLESEPSSVYSCQNCRANHRSVCNNSLHFTDFRKLCKKYPEYLTPQQISKSTRVALPPHVHRAISHRKVTNEDRLSIFNDRKILVFNKSSTVEKNAEKSNVQNDFSHLSYHLTKTFHSPPPNRNPFDLSEAHF